MFCFEQIKKHSSYRHIKNVKYGFSPFHAIISCAITTWGPSSYSIRVLRLQKRAIRMMYGVAFRISCKDFVIKMGIMTMPCIVIWNLLVYAKENEFQWTKLNTQFYDTRNAQLLEIPRHLFI